MAKLGVGLLIIPQKPWREVEKELREYNRLYREINGSDAPQPISAGWTFVDESAERARDMAMRYIGGYYRTVLDHYQFAGAHMKNQRGYEYYAKMNEKLAVYGDQKAIEFFADLQVYGTPEQVHDKVMAIHKQTNNSAYVGVFSYAGMPHEEAARNMRLFARTVMPELKAFDAGSAIDRSAAPARLAFRRRRGSKAKVSLPDHRGRAIVKGLDAFRGLAAGPAVGVGRYDRRARGVTAGRPRCGGSSALLGESTCTKVLIARRGDLGGDACRVHRGAAAGRRVPRRRWSAASTWSRASWPAATATRRRVRMDR